MHSQPCSVLHVAKLLLAEVLTLLDVVLVLVELGARGCALCCCTKQGW